MGHTKRIIELEAELASLKNILGLVRKNCNLTMKEHFSFFGPERYLEKIDAALVADKGDALKREKHLRDTLHRLACYPRMDVEDMAKLAGEALSWPNQL